MPEIAPNQDNAGEEKPRIATLFVTYNSAHHLRAFFDGLKVGLQEVTGPIVISDNASTDDSIEIAQALYPDLTVVRNPGNVGYAAAINSGAAAIEGWDALLILNPDIRLGHRAAIELWHQLGPSVGITVPNLFDPGDHHYPSLRRAPAIGRTLAEAVLGGKTAARMGWGEVVADSPAYATSSRADWATGAAWLLSRKCWEDVGTWDESFFLYSEEVEYALRAAARGWELRLAPKASAVHLGGDRLTNFDLYSLMIVNRYRLFRSLRSRLASFAYLLSLALYEAVRAASPIHRAAFRALIDQARGRTHPLLANRD